jgi:hypothetical protein
MWVPDVFDVSSVSSLLEQRESICTCLEKSGISILRGLVDENALASSRALIRSSFNRGKDYLGSKATKSLANTNHQCLLVGSSGSIFSPHSHGQLVRTFYNPMSSEDIFNMHGNFKRLIHVRNILSCGSKELTEGRFWSASRIHQYPAGGGFMGAHMDTRAASILLGTNLRYIQALLVMTQRGVDFSSGGAFIVIDGQVVDLEDIVRIGDIVVYNENIIHGVDCIDGYRELDLNTFNGRISAFVTLFKKIV